MALTEKKKAFAHAKKDGADNREAAIFAGYSPETASQSGARLAKDADVVAYLERMSSVKEDVKPAQRQIITKKDIDAAANLPDPLKFLTEVFTDPVEDMKLRVDAAKAALPYVHGKIGEKGKKESREDDAKNTAQGGGKFATRAARKAQYS